MALVWGLRADDTMPLLGEPERAWHFEAGMGQAIHVTGQIAMVNGWFMLSNGWFMVGRWLVCGWFMVGR